MRFKFTVFLLALNVITFGLILYLGSRSGVSKQQASGLSGKIGREIVAADRIEIRGRSLPAPRVLKRDGSDWVITEPLQWSANYFAINRILNQLQFLEEEAFFAVSEIEKSGQTLADYGLEDPTIQLLIAEGEDEITLSIGTLTEIGNNVYLLGPQKKNIFVVSREVIKSLLVDLSDLRTREIFDIPVFEVDALGVQIRSAAGTSNGNGELKVRLAKTNSGWLFEAPLTAEADPTLVANTINQLTAAKAINFHENSNPASAGLETPFMRVTLFGNKRRQTLLLGDPDPSAIEGTAYFAKLEENSTIFSVAAGPFDQLVESQEALRERNFMKFDPAALTAINISENGRELRLQKLENGEWQVIQSDGDADIQPYRTDPVIIETLIADLAELRASSFVLDAPTKADLDRLGFDTSRRIIVLSLQDAEPVTLLLAHPSEENEKLYAKNNQSEFVYAVERRPTLQIMPLNALDYRNRILETLPPAARVQSVVLERIEDGIELIRYEFKDQSIEEALAEKTETEAEAIGTLLHSIRQMSVKSYLRKNYADAYQLDSEKTLPWAYRLSVQVLLPGDDSDLVESREYVLTERLSGRMQVAGSARHNTIFQVNQELIEAIYVLTEVMPLPPEATGDPVPDPNPIAPLPEPVPVVLPESNKEADS